MRWGGMERMVRKGRMGWMGWEEINSYMMPLAAVGLLHPPQPPYEPP